MEKQTDGGRLLADLRQHASLSQADLAERAGISRSMIAQIERGERRPSRKLLHKLAEAMRTPSEKEDQLIAAFRFVPFGQTPEQVAALLRADKNLNLEQAERIAALVREAYERAVADGIGEE